MNVEGLQNNRYIVLNQHRVLSKLEQRNFWFIGSFSYVLVIKTKKQSAYNNDFHYDCFFDI